MMVVQLISRENTQHVMQLSFSGSQDYRIEDLSMDKLKKVFLSR